MPITAHEITSDLTNISEIDSLIDASYKSKEGTAVERNNYRLILWARKKEIIEELDKRPKKKLKTAEEIIDEIGAPRKKFRRARFGDERVIICGSTNWTDKSRIRWALKQLKPQDTRFVIIGTSKGAEQLAITVAKEKGLIVVQMHPNQKLGGSAIHVRNSEVFRFFKPTRVIAFHNDIDSSYSTALFLKLGVKLGIPTSLITRIDTVKSIAKKMKAVHD